VIEMLQEEPDVTADERKQIVEYLSASFKPGGRIYVNLAGAADLARLFDVPLADAERIVQYRMDKGPFADADAVKGVPGITVDRIDAKARELEF
jgi:DNA uptake protein ComE-like DNA-binding protein